MHIYIFVNIQTHDPPSHHVSNSQSKPVIRPHLPPPVVTCVQCSRQLPSFPCQQHLMCAGLWCLVEGDTSCKTKLDPPLDGTECGADKVTPASHCPPPAPSPGHWASLLKGSGLYCAQEYLKHPLGCPRNAHGAHSGKRGAPTSSLSFFADKTQEPLTISVQSTLFVIQVNLLKTFTSINHT